MPTRNRRPFVSQSIWYFLCQEYPKSELIIIDDGEDAIADLVPDDSRIRYIHLERRHPLGTKRNIACEMSQGELIAHWDDDDWMASDRLSIQVGQLLGTGADVCGIRELLHYRIEVGDAWLYRYPAQERPWVAGCTLLYRRSAWAAHRFSDINVGEDSAFVRQISHDRIHALEDTSFYVALIHPQNTGAKNMADPRWERRPMEEVTRLLALDRDFYVALRSGRSMQNLARSRSVQSTVTVGAQYDISTGYGSMAEYLVLGLARAGATVNIVPLDLHLEGLTQEFREMLQRSRSERGLGAPAIYFSWPRGDLERFRSASDLFINTMWESNRLPSGWAGQLNRANAVIVPTRFVAQTFRDSGVTVPIEVVPEGVDPDIYHYLDRPDHPGLTTLTIGPVDDRKHVLRGITAWKMAFANDPDARLIIKTQYNYQNYVPDDPRIRYVDVSERTRGIMHWYKQADVLLALGNEGFGLPMVEAMASGIPVIALNSEGQGDVCEEAHDYLLAVPPSDWQPYNNVIFGPCGIRGVPSVEDVSARLRWIASHRGEARQMGRAASDWVLRHRNIWAKGPAVLDVMEQYLRSARPLRSIPTLVVPSWRTPCGVAEYTAHLAEALPMVRVKREVQDMQGVRLLHIQHAPGLFNNTDLTQLVQGAHQMGVPLVITEHAVSPEAHAWERDADVLVALTQSGTNMLQARWPTKRVQHIPLGCPTWFPPRKSSRGKVIGTFGFLERHKGFWHLLDVLRAQPGTELLMFSHAKSAETEARWTEDAKGLPVRRLRGFLPLDEIVRHLASEADILVFWYDEFSHASASYAVRIGLATGVPVLTSPTSWFYDVHGPTYQPANLIEGVQHLIDDTSLREQLTTGAYSYCHDHSWPIIAERHMALWQTLISI